MIIIRMACSVSVSTVFFFFQAEDGIRDLTVTGVQTCALPISEKVDLLVIAEGYTEAELPKFHKDAERMVGKLFATEPFKSRKSDFNVRALDLIEPASGVNRPRTHDDRRTATGVQYNIFDSERYVLTLDDHRMRDVASDRKSTRLNSSHSQISYAAFCLTT